jgi:hypothetical protein
MAFPHPLYFVFGSMEIKMMMMMIARKGKRSYWCVSSNTNKTNTIQIQYKYRRE